jgi:hypothetical protein
METVSSSLNPSMKARELRNPHFCLHRFSTWHALLCVSCPLRLTIYSLKPAPSLNSITSYQAVSHHIIAEKSSSISETVFAAVFRDIYGLAIKNRQYI